MTTSWKEQKQRKEEKVGMEGDEGRGPSESLEALRKSEELFRELVQGVKDYAIYRLSTDGKIETWNEGARRLKGYADEEVIGKPFSIFFAPDEIASGKAELSIQSAIRDGRYQGEGWRIRKDGTRFWANYLITALYDQNNQLTGFSKITKDMTEQKHLVDALSRANSALEEKVRDRTVELQKLVERLRISEGQLIAAKEEALKAVEMKSQFVATLSHEIRTPISSIIGLTSLLRETECTEIQKKYVNLIENAGESLLNLINNILDLSKLEAGKFRLEISTFSLPELVQAALETTQVNAVHKELRFEAILHPEVQRSFEGDPGRIRQILVNFLSNAIKFTSKGQITVSALPVNKVNGLTYVRFEVKDTGIGLSQESVGKLFAPFAQGDESISSKYGGTGLGLSISKSTVNLMHGKIGVDSTLGKGSTFWFEIPLKETEIAYKTPLGKELLESGHSFLKSEARILVAEDHPANQKVVTMFLANLGYRPDLASNGNEAVHAVQNHDYDLILMDCQMPELDGYSATQQIRAFQASKGLKRTPIVALTAHALAGDRQKCLDAGMDDYLSKPLRLPEMKALLSKWLGSRSENLEDSVGKAPIEQATEEMCKTLGASTIDIKRIEELKQIEVEGDPQFLEETVELYFETGKESIHRLQSMLSQENRLGIYAEAHRLKSACGNVGADRLRELCEELEEVASSQSNSRTLVIEGKIHEIEVEFERVYIELKKILSEGL